MVKEGLKEAFAEEQCARAIKTNALYEGKYPLVSALSRPVIAQAVAEGMTIITADARIGAYDVQVISAGA